MDISRTTGNTGPVLGSEGTNSSSNQTHGLLEGHTVAPVTQEGDKPLHRLTPNGWKKWNSGINQWEPTDRFDNHDPEGTWREALTEQLLLDADIDPIFTHNFSRIDGITTKIESYQQRLESPETSPEEREKFTNLISVLTAARNYQYSIITHLANSPTSPDPKIESLQRLSRISVAMKLNERPNKIELIAEKLEKDYSQLETYQERFQALQTAIDNGGPMAEEDPTLISRNNLLNAIIHQSDLIEARVASARLLRPPYETLSDEQQAGLSENKWLCIREDALAQSEDLFAQASLLPLGSNRSYLARAAEMFQEIAEEAQKLNPNQQIIDWFTQSASLRIEAKEAEDANQSIKAFNLNRAGVALTRAALEAQKPNLNQQIIDWFTQSANLYQQAVEASAAGQNIKALHLNNAGNALINVALEAQKPNPNQQCIDWFTQTVSSSQQAVEASAAGQHEKAVYLNRAGVALFNAAQEAQKPNSNQQCIDWFTQSVSLYQQAAKAHDAYQYEKAEYLNRAGVALTLAAKEAQRPNPDQQRIQQYLKEAEDLKIRAEQTDQACTIS